MTELGEIGKVNAVAKKAEETKSEPVGEGDFSTVDAGQLCLTRSLQWSSLGENEAL